MSQHQKIRYGWIKFMYWYTIIGAGLSGLGMLFFPQQMIKINNFAPQDPMMFGVVASVWVAFGILSIFGLRSPLAFLPVLMMQLFYKSIWVIAVVLPLFIHGQLTANDAVFVTGMLTYIIGDLIAIPFSYVFSRQAEPFGAELADSL
ncbi:MAG: hypothetical protein R6U50_10155 [Desulfobacterales bacterium]